MAVAIRLVLFGLRAVLHSDRSPPEPQRPDGGGPHPAFVPGQPVWRVWSGTLKPLTRTSGLADVAE